MSQATELEFRSVLLFLDDQPEGAVQGDGINECFTQIAEALDMKLKSLTKLLQERISFGCHLEVAATNSSVSQIGITDLGRQFLEDPESLAMSLVAKAATEAKRAAEQTEIAQQHHQGKIESDAEVARLTAELQTARLNVETPAEKAPKRGAKQQAEVDKKAGDLISDLTRRNEELKEEVRELKEKLEGNPEDRQLQRKLDSANAEVARLTKRLGEAQDSYQQAMEDKAAANQRAEILRGELNTQRVRADEAEEKLRSRGIPRPRTSRRSAHSMQ